MSRADQVGRARAVGIMSGTSSDGADAAVVEIDRGGARRKTRLLAFASRPYGDELRVRVLGAQRGRPPRSSAITGRPSSTIRTASARESA